MDSAGRLGQLGDCLSENCWVIQHEQVEVPVLAGDFQPIPGQVENEEFFCLNDFFERDLQIQVALGVIIEGEKKVFGGQDEGAGQLLFAIVEGGGCL